MEISIADAMLAALVSPVRWCVLWHWPTAELERTAMPNATLALRLAEAAASWGCYCISIERVGGGNPEYLLH